METFLGLLGACVGAVIFICGFIFGRESVKEKKIEAPELSETEQKQIQEERDRLLKENEAFKELMSYNTNMAYGVTANPLK